MAASATPSVLCAGGGGRLIYKIFAAGRSCIIFDELISRDEWHLKFDWSKIKPAWTQVQCKLKKKNAAVLLSIVHALSSPDQYTTHSEPERSIQRRVRAMDSSGHLPNERCGMNWRVGSHTIGCCCEELHQEMCSWQRPTWTGFSSPQSRRFHTTLNSFHQENMDRCCIGKVLMLSYVENV